MGLENEADLFEPQPAQIAAQPALVVDDFVVEAHPPAARLGDAADHIQQRRLARSARADQPDDLAGRDGHRDVGERIDPPFALPEMLRDGAEFDERVRPPSSDIALSRERLGRVYLDGGADAEHRSEQADDDDNDEQGRDSTSAQAALGAGSSP